MIYLDNAASGFYKPNSVVDAVNYAIKDLSVNSGRSAFGPSGDAEKLVYDTRAYLSKTFNNGVISRVIFTANCTQALNFCILGGNKKGTIVTDVTAHNSVLRPLYHLEKMGYRLRFAKPSSKPYIESQDLLSLVDEKVSLVIMNAVSNVTGYENEFEKVGRALSGDVPFVLDGAQLGGHRRIDMKASHVSALALAGHKGLFAIQGVGALLFDRNYDIDPVIFGGSGNETFEKVPSCYPERLEAGTLNLPSILSLDQGARFAYDNLENHAQTLLTHTQAIEDGLKRIQDVTVYSSPNVYGICSFKIAGTDSATVAQTLWERFKICVRGGYHCAPLLHKFLSTDKEGLVRVSSSAYNTVGEINYFLSAVEDISKHPSKYFI